MKVGIYGRVLNTENAADFFNLLLGELSKREISYIIHEDFATYIENELGITVVTETFASDAKITKIMDVLISIGGDGTLLDTLSIVRESGVPVLGINTGRLGFLASTAKNDISEALDELVNGTYTLDKRTVLQLESDKNLFNGAPYALNDFVLHKKDTSSMITVHAYLNGEFLNSYWSDGLIVATPTGSSGYSLSCGGPIIFPRSSSFVITPIAPHNLNVRPIIVSNDNVISFEVEGRSSTFLSTLDSRSETIDANTQIAIRKADFTMNLIRLSNDNFLRTLRQKLMWGLDQRN